MFIWVDQRGFWLCLWFCFEEYRESLGVEYCHSRTIYWLWAKCTSCIIQVTRCGNPNKLIQINQKCSLWQFQLPVSPGQRIVQQWGASEQDNFTMPVYPWKEGHVCRFQPFNSAPYTMQNVQISLVFVRHYVTQYFWFPKWHNAACKIVSGRR